MAKKIILFISLCKYDGLLQVDPSLLLVFLSSSLRSTCFDIYDQKKTFCKPKSTFLSPKMAWGTYDMIYSYLKLAFWNCVRVVILYLYNIEQKNIYYHQPSYASFQDHENYLPPLCS